MPVIGLTGSLGTGKTTVAGMFKELGAEVLDADKIVHELLSSQGRCFKEVDSTFGKGILKDGEIDRKKLGKIIFDNQKALKRLTDILHPQVKKEIKEEIKRLQNKNKKIIIIDIPLLIESGWHRWVDYVVVVKASRALQVSRAIQKLNITKSQVLTRLRAQLGINEKIKLADFVIDNRSSLKQTRKQVKEIWQRIL